MTVSIAPDVRYRLIQDEAVVIQQKTSEVLALNPVGARVLELVDLGLSQAEMVDVVTSEFDVEPAVARQDLALFLAELVEAGVLVRVVEAP